MFEDVAGRDKKKKGSINCSFYFSVFSSGVGVCGGEGRWREQSPTISAFKCSTFYGLSTPLLMCEEITLFPALVKITCSDMT